MLAARRWDGGSFGLALTRDGNGPRALPTLLRYRSAALAELMRSLSTLQALQAEARADANAGLAAAPAARRRGRRPLAGRNEPEQPRLIKALTARPAAPPAPERAVARPTPPPAPTQPTRQVTLDRGAAPPPRARQDASGTLPDTGPATLALPFAGTKRTRERSPDQSLGLRKTG